MSIVEKAAERLQAMPPAGPVSAAETADAVDVADVAGAAPKHGAPTIERLQERAQAAERPQPSAPAACRVDVGALKRAGMLPTGDDDGRRLADELRRIKRPLVNNAFRATARVFDHAERVIVTSAEAGEGKTFAVMNLALSLARETDFEVLLVDGDTPKSDVSGFFGLAGKPGLMDVLADEARAPADVIARTDIPNLLVVPAGTRHPLAAELLRSRRMDYVLDELGSSGKRRLVLFDSPPLLTTSESQVLAAHMGQVVMVVAAGRTRRQALTAALHTLSDRQYVGLVLNKSQLPPREEYYSPPYDPYFRALKGEG